jgi:hypothetical protein
MEIKAVISTSGDDMYLPFLTYQSDGFSDIQNTFTDYSSIKTYI